MNFRPHVLALSDYGVDGFVEVREDVQTLYGYYYQGKMSGISHAVWKYR